MGEGPFLKEKSMHTSSVVALVPFLSLLLATLVYVSLLLGSLGEVRIGLHAAEPPDAASNHRLTLIGDDAAHQYLVLHALLFTVIAIALGVFVYGLNAAGGPPAGLTGFAS